MAATLSSVVWVIGLAVLVVAVALVAIVLRRRSASGTRPAAPADATVAAPPPDVPMTDLEAALAKVTDENHTRDELLKGNLLADVYVKYGVL